MAFTTANSVAQPLNLVNWMILFFIFVRNKTYSQK